MKNTNRIFVKGHARYKLNNKPINQDIELILKRAGFYTFLTRPTDSRSESEWGKREGDVYGFRL
ncbi:MAG: hypothetical protein GTO02_23095 [Candidatus Dadabacteria bacterium]|nr:hypothetical protein [Candidatus Dadabacteria bacterium]